MVQWIRAARELAGDNAHGQVRYCLLGRQGRRLRCCFVGGWIVRVSSGVCEMVDLGWPRACWGFYSVLTHERLVNRERTQNFFFYACALHHILPHPAAERPQQADSKRQKGSLREVECVPLLPHWWWGEDDDQWMSLTVTQPKDLWLGSCMLEVYWQSADKGGEDCMECALGIPRGGRGL